jgi:hypothetical protein
MNINNAGARVIGRQLLLCNEVRHTWPVPGIHVFSVSQGVDGPDKPGHDHHGAT